MPTTTVYVNRKPTERELQCYYRGCCIIFPGQVAEANLQKLAEGTGRILDTGLNSTVALSGYVSVPVAAAIENARLDLHKFDGQPRFATTPPINTTQGVSYVAIHPGRATHITATRLHAVMVAPMIYTDIDEEDYLDLGFARKATREETVLGYGSRIINYNSGATVPGLGRHSKDIRHRQGRNRRYAFNLQQVEFSLTREQNVATCFLNSYRCAHRLQEYPNPVFVFYDADNSSRRFVLVTRPFPAEAKAALVATVTYDAKEEEYVIRHVDGVFDNEGSMNSTPTKAFERYMANDS